jgi:ABC-type lipopolysaccharide export system ATPase subunit
MEPTLEAQKSISTDNAIVVKGLRKSFKKLTVLNGIDLYVKRGTVLALLGPNGAGKTTTIRILSTLLLPDGGQALIHSFDVVREASKVRSLIGLTGQYAAVDEYLTGEENLHMIGRLYRLSHQVIKRRTQELLELFDLMEASARTVKTYSGGMRRRLDLAVSLIAARNSSTLYPWRKVLSTVFTAIPFAYNFYSVISFKHCGIRMKINAGPSGLAVISLQKVDSLLVF